MVIKYVGRTTDFKGKTVWEIVGNLQNFGVGRIIIRSRQQKYPEPCYMRILKVLPDQASHDEYDNPRKVIALVEKVFRGQKATKPTQLFSSSYKSDHVLIPKNEEYKFEGLVEHKEKILPRYLDLPPLLQEYVKRTTKKEGESVPEESLRCELKLNKYGIKYYRIAREGETPNVEAKLGLGKPVSPNLYANVHFD